MDSEKVEIEPWIFTVKEMDAEKAKAESEMYSEKVVDSEKVKDEPGTLTDAKAGLWWTWPV